MTKAEFKKLIEEGHEIEFVYKNKGYSITYYKNEIGNILISFCEYDKVSVDVETFEELCNIKYNDVTVLEMIEALTEKDEYYIY